MLFVADIFAWSLTVIAASIGVLLAFGIPVICAMKGKRGFFLAGLIPTFHILWFVGAIRLAKPHSYWARHWYGGHKMARARQHFGG